MFQLGYCTVGYELMYSQSIKNSDGDKQVLQDLHSRPAICPMMVSANMVVTHAVAGAMVVVVTQHKVATVAESLFPMARAEPELNPSGSHSLLF
eukprot:scaffold206661_cov78-Attheya_sp.AAC.1